MIQPALKEKDLKSWFAVNGLFRRRLLTTLVALLVLQLLGSISSKTIVSSSAAVSSCTTSQITVTAKHNSVFYFDNGTSITSGYVQYEIVNKGSSGTFWAKLENFTGGALGLSTYESATRSLGTLAKDAASNQYWYLTASAVSASAQNHDVVIYTTDPSSGGGTALCKLNRGLSRTESTISASANKVTSVEYSSLPAVDANGGTTFTATVKGQTGTIGQGPTKNYDVNLNPATHKDFAVGRYRLSGTSYTCATGSPVTARLYIPNACEGNYTAIFTFQYISDSAPGLTTLSPIMQIASGTQMKHTSTPSFTIASIGTVSVPQVTTVGATIMTTNSATLNGTSDVGTFTSYYFCLSETNPGSSFGASCTDISRVAVAPTSPSTYYTFNVSSLTNKTTYYFEFVGVSGGTNYYGGVKTFSILFPDVVDTTTAASLITSTSATLNGEQINLNPTNFLDAFFVFTTVAPSGYSIGTPQRSQRLDPYLNETATATSSTPFDTFAANLIELNPNTKYYFELVVVDTATAQYFGGIQEFTTLAAEDFEVTFDPNGGILNSGQSVDTATVLSGADALLNKPNPNPTRSGFTFLGWNTTSGATTVLSTYPVTGNVTLYAVWQSTGGGGGAPPPPPPPPVITSLSSSILCAVSNELVIYGSAFEGASVTFDGISVPIKQAGSNSLVVNLPAATIGIKTIIVTTPNGQATSTINYLTASKPRFQPIRIPYLSQGVAINLDLVADDARSFRLIGRLPAGVTFSGATGLISGTPTENGVYVLNIVAVGVCGEATALLELDIDAPTPNAMSHRINFLPGTCTLTDSARASFEAFIERIKGLSPRNIIPDIYISGGSRNSDPNSPLATCRQESICDLLLIEDLTGDILTDVFSGAENRIEIIVYWPRPNDD